MAIGWHYFVYCDSVQCLKKNVNQYLESFLHLGSSCGAIINFHLLAASVEGCEHYAYVIKSLKSSK